MNCDRHFLDNQGFCHECGAPLPDGIDNWIAYCGDFTAEGIEKAINEWEAKLEAWPALCKQREAEDHERYLLMKERREEKS